MTAWHDGPLVGYDIETTGTDVWEDRIIQAAIVYTTPGERPRTIQWLLDPGQDVPHEAAKVHGWTHDRVLAEVGGPYRAIRSTQDAVMGMHVDGALGEIAGHLATAAHAGVPIVIANAPYDATLTDTELTRHGIDPIHTRPTGWVGVIDPMVLEKAYDPFRKVKGGCKGGKYRCGGCGVTDKTLTSLCTHYGIRLTKAHDAAGDALAAVRLAQKHASLWPEVARWKLGTLHNHQVTWRHEQADSLRAYFDRTGVEHDGVDPGWPVHTHLQKAETST